VWRANRSKSCRLTRSHIYSYYGLDSSLAIAAVTSTPAELAGFGHRLGYLRKGYDADLVVWDSHPLALGVCYLRTSFYFPKTPTEYATSIGYTPASLDRRYSSTPQTAYLGKTTVLPRGS
jgi:hypothetical protein